MSTGEGGRERVLFVDDEPRVTDGLRRLLRGYRDRWEMTFVNDPDEALRLTREQGFDVVVSDMRMPGMDGAELLERIRQLSPNTVRIILSGQSEASSIIRSVGPSHQFIAKPCDGPQIEQAIAAACRLRSHLRNPDLLALVGGIETIPSLPEIYTELMDALRNEASGPQIGQIIERDLGMTVKILQLVNSSYFGMSQPITSAARAVMVLGTETLQALVLGRKIFESLKVHEIEGETVEELWERSSRAAGYARLICREEGIDSVMETQAITATFLHELGLLILGEHAPEALHQARQVEREEGLPRDEAERSVLGATHGDVGAYLVGLWGFPDPIVEAVAFHHSPARASGTALAPVTIVHVAQALADAWAPDEKAGETEPPAGLDRAYLRQLGYEENLARWCELCLEPTRDD
ncbi:MAG: HDOD domain-containing protein [Myxococcota bacterium]